MGYKFQIQYKSGATNRVADALSRRDEADEQDEEAKALFVVVAQPLPDIIDILQEDTLKIPELTELMSWIREGTAPEAFRAEDGLIFCGRQLVVAQSSAAKAALLCEHHSTPLAGHPGV